MCLQEKLKATIADTVSKLIQNAEIHKLQAEAFLFKEKANIEIRLSSISFLENQCSLEKEDIGEQITSSLRANPNKENLQGRKSRFCSRNPDHKQKDLSDNKPFCIRRLKKQTKNVLVLQ